MTGPVIARTRDLRRLLDELEEFTPSALAPYLDDLDEATAALQSVVEAAGTGGPRTGEAVVAAGGTS